MATSSPKQIDGDIGDAVSHLIQGKRHLLVQDYISAVSSLEEACQLFAQKYGESADECGEPYLHYGKALLELARMETGVLGNALEGVPEEEEESESDDDSQVESPDNVPDEEREKIKQDVDAAIDENSRDLEEKFNQLKEKSESSSEHSAPTAKDDGDPVISVPEFADNSGNENMESEGKELKDRDGETMDATEDQIKEMIDEKTEAKGIEGKSDANETDPANSKSEKTEIKPEETTSTEELKEQAATEETKNDADPKVGEIQGETSSIREDGVEKMEEDAKASETDDGTKATDEPVEKTVMSGSEMKDEESKNKEKTETINATNENENFESDIDESMEEEGVEEKEENGTNECDEANKSQDAAGSSAAGPNENKEDDVSNLQLAWEVLELAMIIFKRQSETDKKMELKTAEVLLKLGEISIESENYKQAIDDFSECLRLQKLHLTTDDRAIAETFYQLGLAYSFFGQYEESIENFHKSMQVIEERIANLQQSISDQQGLQSDAESFAGIKDSLETSKRETEDLKSLLPDIKTKIEDTEDMMKNSAVAFKEVALQRLQEDTFSSSAKTSEPSSQEQTSSKPTTNITHLLKRKRKSDGNVDPAVEAESKKKRAASLDHVSNRASNGDVPLVMEGVLKDVESTA